VRASLQLIVVLAALVLGLLLGSSLLVDTPAAHAQTTLTPGHCGDRGTRDTQVAQGTLPSGALYLICVPPQTEWNGELVIYAHGYTPVTAPLGFQNLVLAKDAYLPDLVLEQEYAFATTSYRRNGLAILEGAKDIRELAALFPEVNNGQTARHTYLTGVSEGALITTLLVERSPDRFSGGLAACGPIGSFRGQINYFGDFRVLFDYFFPGVLPGSPVKVPKYVIRDWESTYVPKIEQALANRPLATAQLMTTFFRSSGAPIDLLRDPATWRPATVNLLWYNVFATNDARRKLRGNPFGNRDRWYTGSANDLLLNQQVKRFSADEIALRHLAPYETSGRVRLPLVTLHTTGDEVIPYWQEQRYLAKVQTSGEGRVTPIPILGYGHCDFSQEEVLAAFKLLAWQVNRQ
jgi:pimeloyl-ACP methyl ester carboxylesterase